MMRRSKKIAILTACALIIVGFVLALSALIVMKFDLSRLNTLDYHTATYPIQESFSAIQVDVTDCDVQLLPSQDGTCRVECPESRTSHYAVEVKQGVLTVSQNDTGAWYNHVGIYLGPVELTIYLPQDQYERLSVDSLSGTVSVPDNFSFDNLQVYTTSGSVYLAAQVTEEVCVDTVSGELELTGTQPQALRLQSTSGNVTLTDCDAKAIHIETISGNVSAALTSSKTFSVQTVSGDVRTPQGTTGDLCEISTVSGNITCTIP